MDEIRICTSCRKVVSRCRCVPETEEDYTTRKQGARNRKPEFRTPKTVKIMRGVITTHSDAVNE